MTSALRVVGKPVHKQGDQLRATGQAQYSSDAHLPGMLHGSILNCPYPSADLVSIDTSAAAAVPGVKLILTPDNCSDVLARTYQYIGHPVACVVATTLDIAQHAISLIKVEYKQKAFVVDPDEAMKPDSPQVFPGFDNLHPFDLCSHFSERNEQGLFAKREAATDYDGFGDVEKGFAEADVIVEDEGYRFGLAHAPVPERRGGLAHFDGEKLTVWSTTQSAQQTRGYIGSVAGLQIHNVRVISEFNSGSFGARGDDTGFLPDSGPDVAFMGAGHDKSVALAVKASVMLLKPVRIFLSSNEENFYHFWGRGTTYCRVKLGFKKDGTLTTWDMELAVNSGLFGNRWTFMFSNGTALMLYSRNAEHVRIKKYAIFTNTPGQVGWCGYGNPEYMFATEQVMDQAAEILGMDPVELRKKNHMRPGDNILNVSRAYAHTGPNWLGSGDISAVLDLLMEETDWKSRKPASEKTGVVRHGLGMALTCQQCAGEGVGSNAIVKLNHDGTAELCNTYADTGMGGRSACRQIAAEELGLTFDKVRIIAGDTDASVWGTSNACSGGTMKYGWAVALACRDALKTLFELSAPLLKVAQPSELATVDGEVFVKADPTRRIKWEQAFLNQGNNDIDHTQIVGKGVWIMGSGPQNTEKAATFVSLDVDTETGQLLNVKIYHCADVGRALNAKDTKAQILRIHHGFESVLGATMILDKATGRLLNGSYIDYPVATMWDCDVHPYYIESGNDPTHPYGAVGLGQALQNGIHAATANAIYNAIGVRIKDTPMTPDVILKALTSMGEQAVNGAGAATQAGNESVPRVCETA